MYQKVKGTQDFIGLEAKKLRYVESKIRSVIEKYGYEEIITPIFENTEVFVRSAGEESDIVSKEMYTFSDKGGRSLTLRPEGTAPVVRSFLENKLYAQRNLNKFYYFGPMFRYERPQAGRFREFNQFGIETFGTSSPLLDADVIISGTEIFNALGIKNIKLKINTIGDFPSRTAYAKLLQDYFRNNISSLCRDCNRRLEKNPLRILDCKIDKDNPVLKNAPKIDTVLSDEAKIYFQSVIDILDAYGVNYEVDRNLVRGLDYYTDTVFEYILDSNDELGGLAICAGGKYSDMVKSFKGPDIPGIGYAFGIERIIAIMDLQNLFPALETGADIVLIGLDEKAKEKTLLYANKLRMAGFYAEMDYVNINLKPQFKLSDQLQAKYLIIIGEEELNNKVLTVKNNTTKEQESIPEDRMIDYFKEKIK
ncbi:MAG TPA: histidine--tRNA ligase [Acholeplasmataceae bacterium]|nr:histidine--tRNA ligase [Acholeplasmataceae bacterium]